LVRGFAGPLYREMRCHSSPLLTAVVACPGRGASRLCLASGDDLNQGASLCGGNIRHPVGSNGCRAAAPPLLRFPASMFHCYSTPSGLSPMVEQQTRLGIASSSWRRRRMKPLDLIAFCYLLQGCIGP
jgi:hypothetical protein